jgi:hypothetical protein
MNAKAGSLLLCRADAGKVSRDARIQTRDTLRERIHRGDEREAYSRDDQRILDKVLTLLITYNLRSS